MSGGLVGRPAPPGRVPRAGAVLRLAAGQWGPDSERRPLTVRVARARPDRSLFSCGRYCWVHGVEIDRRGATVRQVDVQVLVDAIPDEAADAR